MKKLLTTLFVISALCVKAQFPQGINYQSIIRNTSGVVLPSTAVTVQFKLYSSPTSSISTVLLYDETHSTTTNSFGMVNLVIGHGTPIGGAVTFNNIPWIIGVEYEVWVNSSQVGTRQPFMSVPYALNALTADWAPAPTVTFSNSILSVGNNSVTIPTGQTYAAGTGIAISGNTITNNAPDQTVTLSGSGATNITGTYPNFIINTPTVAPDQTVTLNGSGATNITGTYPNFTINTPTVAPDQTVTISGVNSATVLGAYPNFTVDVPASPIYNAGTDISITAGLINNTAPDKTVTINAVGAATVTGAYPNFTLNVPSGTALPNGYSGQLLFNNGTIWDTIPRTNLYFDGTNFGIGTLLPQANFHVVGAGRFDASVTTPQIYTDNIKITGGTTGQVLTSDNLGNGTWQSPSSYSLTQSGPNINLTQNGTAIATVTLTAATSTSLVAGSSNIILNQSGNAYTITPVTPIFTNSGPTTITGTYPNYTVTSASSPSTTLVQGNNVNLNQSGNTYTVSSVTPTLTVIGGSLSGPYPTQTLTIPSGSTTLVSGTNVTLNQSGNTYTISSTSQSLTVNTNSLSISGGNTVIIPTSTVLAGSNITVIPTGNTYSVSAVTPTLNVSGGALTGSYPNQTLTIPTSSTTILTPSTNVVIAGSAPNYTISSPSQSLTVSTNSLSITGGNTVIIPTSTVLAGTNITVVPTGNSYSVSAVTPTLSVTGGTLSGSYPNQTLSIPTSSTTILTASTNVVVTGTAPNYTIAAIEPLLSLSGNTLTSGPSTNSVSLAGFNGIYGGSGSLTTGNTTVTIATNTLTFLSGTTTNKPIANFFGGGITGTHLAIGHTAGNPASIKLLGSVLSSPVDYGYVSGSSNGVAISGGTSSNGLFVTNSAEVGIGTFVTGIGKFMITHAASAAAPTMHLRETSANSLTRMKFSNTNVANSFFEIATQVTSTFNTSALSINVNDASNVYNPVFLISGGRQVYVNALNLPLASFHVMESAATSGGGIISEGFAQPGQIIIARNNQTATLRTLVTSGNEIGRLIFSGFNGTSYNNFSGKIAVNATENYTGSSLGSEMVFSTVPNGTTTAQQVMRLMNDGRVEVKNGLLIPYGGPSAGKVLTSDATGNASWQTPAAPANFWSQSGGNVFLTNSTDWVGIGTNTPNSPLHVPNYLSFESNGSNTSLGSNTGGGVSPNNYYNTFVGAMAGQVVGSGIASSNSFLGYQAGQNNADGDNNTFVGANAGTGNTIGSDNSFFGTGTGRQNTTGNSNVFIGHDAGLNNITASGNTFIGDRADLSTPTQYTNATAIGFNAHVNANDAMILGNGAKIGIGTTTPEALFHVAGNGSQVKIGNTNQPALEWVMNVNPVGNLILENENTQPGMFINAGNGNVAFGTINPGFVSGASKYLTVVTSGAYSPTSNTSLELVGNINQASTSIARMDFVNTISSAAVARIEAMTSAGSTAQGSLRFLTNGGALLEAMRITETANVGIGTTTPTSMLQVNGSMASAVRVVAASTTLTNTDFMLIINSASATVTLPAASSCTGRMYVIKVGSGSFNISSYRDIAGNLVSSIPSNSVIRLISDGTNWQGW